MEALELSTTEAKNRRYGSIYQTAVTVIGLALSVAMAVSLFMGDRWPEQLRVIVVIPVLLSMSLIQHTLRIPLGLKFSNERLNLSLADPIVLLVACWLGVPQAIVVASIEGFVSSRRSSRRLASNLFSASMMAITAGAAGLALHLLLSNLGDASAYGKFVVVSIAFLAASVVHIAVNWAVISPVLALRHGRPILQTWISNIIWAGPMFLPTSSAASLVYFAVEYDAWFVFVIGGPVIVSLYFAHRQYSTSAQELVQSIEQSQKEKIGFIEKAHRETIEALAVAINAKDEVTHDHVMRVQIYSAGVARILGCSDAEVEALKAGALLHDIGKIAVPDYILNKPGKLTKAEFEKMKLHTVVGAQILGRVDFPYPIVPVVRHHHERWDGKGYPDGLHGEEIPLTARILSVVDCFDALREDRQYRGGMTREEAINFIMSSSGTMYDPKVVGVFITHLPEFEAEILARRDDSVPTYGIEPIEQLSEAALAVKPAAGLAEEVEETGKGVGFSTTVLAHLYELAQKLNAASDESAILQAFAESLSSSIPFDTCCIALLSVERDQYEVKHVAGRNAHLLSNRVIVPGEGVLGWVIANRSSFFNADPRLDGGARDASHFSDYRTLGIVPLSKGDEVYGAVALYSCLTSYGEEHQAVLKEAVAMLSAALSNRGSKVASVARVPGTEVSPKAPSRAGRNLFDSDLTH